MTAAVAPVHVEVPRDRWKRPLILQPDGSKVAYTRASTFAGYPDDTTNLTKWKQRKTAHGLSLRPDLQLRIVSLGPEPDRVANDAEFKAWKANMDEICEAAMEAAGSSTAATIGSALHSFTDRIDQGLELGIVPDAYKPHLQAYEQATRDLTAVHMERFVVCDELLVAGTADRFVKVEGHDKLVCADTKSGNVDFAAKIAIQMAVYAHGKAYDPATGARADLGSGLEVDLERGLIIALNALRGTCDLIWVDLTKGWRGARVAAETREWRKEKKFTAPYQSVTATPLPLDPTPAQEQARDLTAEASAALIAGIRNASSRDELVQLWTAAGGSAPGTRWQPQHDELVQQRLAELAKNAA